jgi:Ca-activated chloride channel family protein
MRRAAVLVVALLALTAFGALDAASQTATITGPSQAVVGSTIEITWTGPSAALDFISVDAAGAPESTYGPYIYANVSQPGSLSIPDAAGNYVIRYHTSASGYPVIASTPLTITDVGAPGAARGAGDAGAGGASGWAGPAPTGA